MKWRKVTPRPKHMVMVGSNPEGWMWRAVCTCGWESDVVANLRLAREASDKHLTEESS